MNIPMAELLREKIAREGPVSFRDFMEFALYFPETGYYTSGKDKIGKEGDFFTSPWFTTLFGDMLAVQIEEMWRLLGCKAFTVVEFGAGTGVLCRDILQRLRCNTALYDNLRYVIIERSPAMRQKEKRLLEETGGLAERVCWVESVLDIPPFEGCILSNELIDNLPVHQVVMEQDLMEVFVEYRDGGFVESLRPASDSLKKYLEELRVVLPAGFRTEINLDAVDWITDNARALTRGFLLTIDYGYSSPELYRKPRDQGTLVCYRCHQVNDSPYEHIGEQDITAHVNFSALRHWGERAGLLYGAFTKQAYFLQGLGLTAHLKKLEAQGQLEDLTPLQKESIIRTLLMGMGNKIKVLVQYKGLERGQGRPGQLPLSGFRFPELLI